MMCADSSDKTNKTQSQRHSHSNAIVDREDRPAGGARPPQVQQQGAAHDGHPGEEQQDRHLCHQQP